MRSPAAPKITRMQAGAGFASDAILTVLSGFDMSAELVAHAGMVGAHGPADDSAAHAGEPDHADLHPLSPRVVRLVCFFPTLAGPKRVINTRSDFGNEPRLSMTELQIHTLAELRIAMNIPRAA